MQWTNEINKYGHINAGISLLDIGKHPVFQIGNIGAVRISHSKFWVETKLEILGILKSFFNHYVSKK